MQASFLRIKWALRLEGVLIAKRLLRLLSTGLEEGEMGGVGGGVVVLVVVVVALVVLVVVVVVAVVVVVVLVVLVVMELGRWSVISTAR